jgi:hypothetical protein
VLYNSSKTRILANLDVKGKLASGNTGQVPPDKAGSTNLLSGIDTLYCDHAGHMLDRSDNFIEVFLVKNLDSNLNNADIVL